MEPFGLNVRVGIMAILTFPLQRAKQFEQLVRPLLPGLYRQAYRLCGSRDNAEDLVQELLTRLFAQATPLHELENIKMWLLKALYHQFIDFVRKQKQHKCLIMGEAAEQALLALPCPQGSAEEATEKQLTYQRIEAVLLTLNADQRAVIVLHDMEGYTLNELAVIQEVPVGTIKSRLHRARQCMREVLEREPFTDDLRVTV